LQKANVSKTLNVDRTMKGQVVQAGTLEMHYEEYGKGPPMLLLHGFGGCTKNWHPFVEDLSQKFRLIVVDLRGHGSSTNPDKVFTHRQAAADVSQLLDKLEIGVCQAMGMSTGGMILLHMALMQPQRISAMALISATTHFPDQARAIMRRVSYETMPPEVQTMYRECAKRGEGQIRELVTQFNAFHQSTDDVNFSDEALSRIKSRTLIVHGDRDQFFPVQIAVELYRSIPDSALWIVPNGEHVPVFDLSIPFVSTALRFFERE
jgi:pimeloyl-ACP methyl ester carboxylesterase